MNDKKIITLLETRDESAIADCQTQYGKLCHTIAFHILGNNEDAEECVNDAMLKLWQSIPPHKPDSLSAYLTVLVRNCALDRYRRSHKQSSPKTELTIALHEIEEIFPESSSDDSIESFYQKECINHFLATLSDRDRRIFLFRYFYVYPTHQLASMFHTTEAYVRVVLARTLKKFKRFLEKEWNS